MLWITGMNNTNVWSTQPIQMDDGYYDDYVVQPGQGAIYTLSGDTETEIVLLDKDGKPFYKPEKRIGFV
jgi:hypothetical protein